MPVDSAWAKGVLERALGAAKGADEAEAWLSGGAHALTRFAENTIHQNVQDRSHALTVRAVCGKRTARAETNRLDEVGLRACVENAVKLAKLSPESDDLLPVVADGGTPLAIDAFDAGTAASTPEARADAVRAVVDACAREGATAAGAFETVDGAVGDYGEMGTVAFLNSKGLFRFHSGTHARFTLTVTRGDATGWASADSWRLGDLDPQALGKHALGKALRGSDPKDLAPGRYTVVLEPAAVAELFWFLSGAFSGQDVEEGRSPLCGKLGQKVGAETVTIVEDPAAVRACPFDDEGTATRRVVLIEKGVHKALVHDRKTAKKAGAEPTGHAPRQPSTWGPHPRALTLAGGAGSVEDLVKTVEKGVLVTRFWYSNTVDERQGLVTGMTRDGLFWIEKGEVRHPLRNMRYNESLLGVLERVERLGAQQRVHGALVPPAVVKDFHFASGTKF